MKNIRILLIAIFSFFVISCSTNEPIIFDDAFVYLLDENGQMSSEIPWDSNHNLVTYYVNLVCPKDYDELSVNYELIVGDGLQEGVDFKHIKSTSSPLFFPRGIYRMPIRIEWLKHKLNPEKDNSLTISLVSVDFENEAKEIRIGRPGPDHIGSKYKIVKRN